MISDKEAGDVSLRRKVVSEEEQVKLTLMREKLLSALLKCATPCANEILNTVDR